MGPAESRPRWQTAVLILLFSGVFTGIVYVFRENPLILGLILAILGAGLSLTALREETRQGKLARLFLGPLIFSASLYSIVEIDVALAPAVVFLLLSLYYGFSDLVNEDPLGVNDDPMENQ